MPIIPIDSKIAQQRCCQQECYNCQPLLHPGIINGVFGSLAVLFIVIGSYFTYQGQHLFYEEVQFAVNSSATHTLQVDLNPDLQTFVYYKLPNFYQNVRTYGQSIDYEELASPALKTAPCTDDSKAVLCSLIWKTKPTYTINLKLNTTPITLSPPMLWESDAETNNLFGKGVKQQPKWEEFAVWARQSPFKDAVKPIGSFKSGSGSLEIDFTFNQYNKNPVVYVVVCQVNTAGGSKENGALGVVCIVVGGVMLLVVFGLLITQAAYGARSKKYNEKIE
ncbi:Cell_division protein 50 [Hexamita inflata]|uniref:Cell division protein 50 n=1 Tax=Hexamita inflata TaxID=28002 RepID=A0AA86TRN0_9EUKA|nr:Cell division protein 50 [Hexamita inflata]